MQLSGTEKNEIVVLRKYGHSIDWIASKMKRNRKSVMRWDKRFKETGNVERKEGSRAERMTTISEDEKISQIIKDTTTEKSNVRDMQNKIKEQI
jgi:transposase